MLLTLQRTSSIREVGSCLIIKKNIKFCTVDEQTMWFFSICVACHILECPHGRASEVLNSIGQAFETRFRQLLSQTSTLLSTRLFTRWYWMGNSYSLSATRPAKMSSLLPGQLWESVPSGPQRRRHVWKGKAMLVCNQIITTSTQQRTYRFMETRHTSRMLISRRCGFTDTPTQKITFHFAPIEKIVWNSVELSILMD